jgi:hypothetical protein
MDYARPLLCPSAQPEMTGPRLIGVVERTSAGPRVIYLNEVVTVTKEVLDETQPAPPAAIFRIAATCEERSCTHFNGVRCQLATRIVDLLPPVVDRLPSCSVRSACRWFHQEGGEACVRCPQVVTESQTASPEYIKAAQPGD